MYLTRCMQMLNHLLQDHKNAIKPFVKADALYDAQEEIFAELRKGDPTHGQKYLDLAVPDSLMLDLPEDCIAVFCIRVLPTAGFGVLGAGEGGFAAPGDLGETIDIVDGRSGTLQSNEAVLVGPQLHFGAQPSGAIRLYYQAASLPMFRAKVASVTDAYQFCVDTDPVLGELIMRDDVYIGNWLHVQATETGEFQQRIIQDYTASTGEFYLSEYLSFTPTTDSFIELHCPIPLHLRRMLPKIAAAALSGKSDLVKEYKVPILDSSARNLATPAKVLDSSPIGTISLDYE